MNMPPVSPIKKKARVQLISATRQALNGGERRGLLKYFSQSSKEEYANDIARTLDDVRQKSADVKWAKEQFARENSFVKRENAHERKRRERERKKRTEIWQGIWSPGGRKV